MHKFLHFPLALILILLMGKQLSAQEYVSFPTDSTYQWGQEYSYYPDMVNDTTNMHTDYYTHNRINGDTTICGSSYYKLWSGSDTAWILTGAIREENKKVYYYGFLSYGTMGFLGIGMPVLLYDFNANVGDTVFHYLTDSSCVVDSYSLVLNAFAVKNRINSIDSVQLLDGSYRKRFHTSGGDWVEGIGNVTNGLLADISFDACTCTSYYTYDFTCFSHHSNNLYLNSNYENCDTKKAITSVPNIPNDAHFSIYPNPVNNGSALNIFNKNQENYQVKVVDLLGRTILVNTLKPGNNSLNINQAASTQLLQVLIYDKNNRLVNSNKIIVK